MSPFWSDGADKDRLFAIPDATTITVAANGHLDLPVGTVPTKTYRMDGKRIETRLFVRHDDGGWGGYSYEWNDAETDATLLPAGKTRALPGGKTWIYPSRGECMSCHTQAAGYSLGLEVGQLNSDFVYEATNRISNQLATMDRIGLFSQPLAPVATLPAYPSPTGQASVEARARSYLHANCAQCQFTTNRRVWEWDEEFKEYLRKIRAMAIDMETATLFITAFANEIPVGAILLVSDQPMIPDGVKTESSDHKVTSNFVDNHLQVGIDSLKQLINEGLTVKHLRF